MSYRLDLNRVFTSGYKTLRVSILQYFHQVNAHWALAKWTCQFKTISQCPAWILPWVYCLRDTFVWLLGINKYMLSFQFLLFLFLFGFGVLIYYRSVFLNYMVGFCFYVGLLCFAFVLCLAASLPGNYLFVIVVVLFVVRFVLLLLLLC